jgi:CheY-like chemotaxis protein
MEKVEKKTILFVDDDIDFLIQMKPQLENKGFNVITAESQGEAEEILNEKMPDIVISDLMMENFDGGFGLAYKVKKKDPNIPVIIVTNVANDLGLKFRTVSDDEKEWIKADVLLSKPVRCEQLINEINKFFHLEAN